MNRLTVIVGAGGTGSYAFPNLVHVLATNTQVKNTIVLIDGDRVEGKNLLRQGFLQKDLDENKAEVLVKRYSKAYPNLGLWFCNQYINDVNCLLGVVNLFPAVDEVVFISCVDNNYARLRLFVAQCKLFQESQIPSYFIDAGNGEWFGQVITSKVSEDAPHPLLFDSTGQVTADGAREQNLTHLNNIFVKMDNWRDRLTRGDHELSCDEVAESHPQNIGTNMMSASMIVKAMKEVLQNQLPLEYRFNGRVNRFTVEPAPESARIGERLVDIADFVNTTEDDVIGTTLIPVYPASPAVQERWRAEKAEIESMQEVSIDLADMFEGFEDTGNKDTSRIQNDQQVVASADAGIMVDLDSILDEISDTTSTAGATTDLDDWLADFII
ncbi:hypothetical protein B4086_5529 [Bacillus cereus]|nr:hypothetical protein B4086_5529 [Bacillus cereus]